jgi:hypothetical protein
VGGDAFLACPVGVAGGCVQLPGSAALPTTIRAPPGYSLGYNVTACGLERLHPFDSQKYRRIHDWRIRQSLPLTRASARTERLAGSSVPCGRSHPADLYLVVLDNGVYEVTGGPPVPGAGRTDFAGLARAAGVRRVYACATAAEWSGVAAEALSGPGPVVVWLNVVARPGERAPTAMRLLQEQIARLRQMLRRRPGWPATT